MVADVAADVAKKAAVATAIAIAKKAVAARFYVMRKAFIYLSLTLLGLLSLESKAQGVKFFEGTVYEALAEAKKSGKLLLVEFYADWDHSSRWMHQTISSSEELNNSFVASSLNTNEPENAGLAQVYQVSSYPAIVIFKSNGSVVDKLTKAMERDEFEAYLKEIRIQNELSFVELNTILWMAKGGKDATEKEVKALIDNYIATASEDLLHSQSAWDLFTLEGYSAYGTTPYWYLVKNYENFYDSQAALSRAQQLYYEAIMPIISGIVKDTTLLEEFKNDTLSQKNIKGAKSLIQLCEYRIQELPAEYLLELENTLGNISQSIDYQLVISLEFTTLLLSVEHKATKRKARQILEEYLKYCTSPSKIAIIESLLEKFS
ncbi:MAG: thioredoxin family protein [Rikenellaceae bacterium]